MDKDIVIVGPQSISESIIGLVGNPIRVIHPTEIFMDDFRGDSRVLRRENIPRRTGVAKDRRVARKKRAKKLARRR